jgi:hypothetical protein
LTTIKELPVTLLLSPIGYDTLATEVWNATRELFWSHAALPALVLFLLDHGVFVHPGYFYGDVPGCHVMLSALCEPERFALGVERLCAALA